MSRKYMSDYENNLEICASCKAEELDEDGMLCASCEIVPYRDNRGGHKTYFDNDGIERREGEDW